MKEFPYPYQIKKIMKMVASVTRDIKCLISDIVKRLFDSAVEIAEDVRINVSQFIYPFTEQFCQVQVYWAG